MLNVKSTLEFDMRCKVTMNGGKIETVELTLPDGSTIIQIPEEKDYSELTIMDVFNKTKH